MRIFVLFFDKDAILVMRTRGAFYISRHFSPLTRIIVFENINKLFTYWRWRKDPARAVFDLPLEG
jgi:hypothetical protein